jgi:ABC-2 type transport system ATP-binding protein
MMKEGRIVALGSTAGLLAEFSERVLRVKLESGSLPAALAARAQADAAGGWRIPIKDVAYVEEALRELRTAGAAVAKIEVAEPELEEVFVKIMRREEKVL